MSNLKRPKQVKGLRLRKKHTPTPQATSPKPPSSKAGAHVRGSHTGSKKKKKARTAARQKAVAQTQSIKGIVLEELQMLTPLEVLAGHILPDEPDEKLTAAACGLVKVGVHVDVACKCFGIDSLLFKRWADRATADFQRGEDTVFVRFFKALDLAEAQDEATDIQLVTLGVKHWQALAWKRERKTSQRWGQKIQAAVGGIAGMPILVQQTSDPGMMSAEKGAEILAILEATGGLGILQGVGSPGTPQEPATADPTTKGKDSTAKEGRKVA